MTTRDSTQHPMVLVVDDEALLRLLASDVLEDNGFRVIEAADADSALRVMVDHPDVRLLFTDVNMPGPLDGIDLAREVHRRWPDVKLLVTSGRQILDDHDLPDSGRFVAKPYAPDELLREIRTIMGRA